MTTPSILIVENDVSLREALADTVSLAGYEVLTAANARDALKHMEESRPVFVISAVEMNGMDGFGLMRHMNKNMPEVPKILMAENATVEQAVEAMHEGAVDYLAKPIDPNLLIDRIKRFLPKAVGQMKAPVAEDKKSRELLALALQVADSDATVMISGESGTGKEVLARYIHDYSSRMEKPFVAINCAAIPENMLEATLFGYEKGAFTGAYAASPGKFEQAQGGSLLLDEISEMDLALQAKLLRVVQEKEVERLGGKKVIKLDVRILATTNRDLREEVDEGRFREDLYYRLNVFPLYWYPLRERPTDILPMAEYLIESHIYGTGRAIPQLTKKAKIHLLEHEWRGNAREMDNVIQRALILSSGDIIEPEDLQLDVGSSRGMTSSSKGTSKSAKNDPIAKERNAIINAL